MWSSASPGWPVAESPVGSPRRMSASTGATLATVAESLQGGAMKRDLSVENEFSVYVGLDWGTEFHRACVLNSRGEILRECRIDHSGQAISDFVRVSMKWGTANRTMLQLPSRFRGDQWS